MSTSIGQQIEELEAHEMQKQLAKQMLVRTLHITENEARRRRNKYLKTKARNKMARKSRKANRK